MPEQGIIHALESALGFIVPDKIAYAVSGIPDASGFVFEEERLAVCQSGDHRKREFSAGRACARVALGKLGYAAQPILSDEDGLPLWPESSLAVITHARGYCASIATKDANYRAIGLDLEKTNRLSHAAIERVVHPLEADFVRADQKMASLLFSAKEAFYKAQYPQWRTSANFHDLALKVDIVAGEASVVQIEDRFPEDLCRLAESFQFRFSFYDDFVVSICWLGRGD